MRWRQWNQFEGGMHFVISLIWKLLAHLMQIHIFLLQSSLSKMHHLLNQTSAMHATLSLDERFSAAVSTYLSILSIICHLKTSTFSLAVHNRLLDLRQQLSGTSVELAFVVALNSDPGTHIIFQWMTASQLKRVVDCLLSLYFWFINFPSISYADYISCSLLAIIVMMLILVAADCCEVANNYYFNDWQTP